MKTHEPTEPDTKNVMDEKAKLNNAQKEKSHLPNKNETQPLNLKSLAVARKGSNEKQELTADRNKYEGAYDGTE